MTDALDPPLDLGHLRSWIGREEEAAERVTPELLSRFRATLDVESAGREGEAVPRLIHLCLGQPAVRGSGLGPDGHPARGGFLPPVPLPRRMWAGGAFEFHDEIRVDEVVTRRSRILDVTAKVGRSGPLVFVTAEHRIDSGGRAALMERQDIVYRGAGPVPAPGAGPPADPAPTGRWSERLAPTSTLLFRYSALTFNGHRIHYDAPYAREVEGYPGLVVHGPLQATWLAHLAERVRGRAPVRFRFRSLAPLFVGDDVTLNADEDGDALRLWTARLGGHVAMEARAEW